MERLPLKVNWRLTYDCDNWRRGTGYGCVFCYSPERKDRVNLADPRQILQLLRDRGVRIVVLTGGEPLSHPQISEIVEFLRDNEILVNLSTNGLHINDRLPTFCDDLAVISLPVDGPSAHVHDGMRNWDGHFKLVLGILEDLQQRLRAGARIPRIKIETVLGNRNSDINTLREMAELLSKYPISVWKIFEYNYYPDRSAGSRWYTRGEDTTFDASKIAEVVSARVPFARCFSKESRSECYFMLNPNGTVVLPTLKTKNGATYYEDDVLGDFMADPDHTIQCWEQRVDQKRFAASLDIMYRYTYQLFDGGGEVGFNQRTVIRDPRERVLWRQVKKCGLAMLYENTDDFSTCRIIEGEPRKELLDYLRVARREVCIIAHLLQGTVDDISAFFREKIANKVKFTMTVVLPEPHSRLASFIAQSRCITLHEDYNVSLARTVDRLEELSRQILLENRDGPCACALKVYTIREIIPYASVVMIDDDRIQVETKFPTLNENSNVILEFVKPNCVTETGSYFEELRSCIQVIIARYARNHLGVNSRGFVNGLQAKARGALQRIRRMGIRTEVSATQSRREQLPVTNHVGSRGRRPDRAIALLGCIMYLGFVCFLLYRNEPFADPNLVVLARVPLSLVGGVVGGTIPGFLNVSWTGKGLAIRAAGALAVFLLTYILTPTVLPLSTQ